MPARGRLVALEGQIVVLERQVAANEMAKSDAVMLAAREAIAEAEGRGLERGRREAIERFVSQLAAVWMPATKKSLTEAADREIAAMQGRFADLLPPTELPPVAARDAPRFEAVFANPAMIKTNLPHGLRTCLIAVAQHRDGVTRNQLTVLTGYKRSTRNAYIGQLATRGLVAVTGDERVIATHAGVAELGPDYQPLPTGSALREHWLAKLPEGERRVLEVLIGAYPEDVQREAIDVPTGYQRSTRNAYIARLISRQLIEFGAASGLRASSRLFENA